MITLCWKLLLYPRLGRRMSESQYGGVILSYSTIQVIRIKTARKGDGFELGLQDL